MKGKSATYLFAAAAALALLAAPGAANAQETLEKIRSEGEITVATEALLPPFEFVRGGEIVGYGKDILTEIVADLGVELEQLDVPFQGILPGLIAGKFDFVATSVGMTPERAASVAFTLPIGIYETGILVTDANEEIQSVEDLSGKIVGTQLGSSLEPVLDEINAHLEESGLEPMAETRLFNGFPELRLALSGGQIDAALEASPSIGMLLTEQPGQFRMAATFGEGAYLGWAVRQEDETLLEYLNSQILRLHENGKLEELQEKWFGYTFELPKTPVELN